MADKPTIQMKKRTNRIVLIAILIFVGCIIVRLFKLSVLDNKFYQEKANEYHLELYLFRLTEVQFMTAMA